jgi:hypothetical protein
MRLSAATEPLRICEMALSERVRDANNRIRTPGLLPANEMSALVHTPDPTLFYTGRPL